MENPKETLSLQIALVADLRSTYLQLGYSEEDCAALPHDGEVDSVLSTLRKLGHRVTLILGVQALTENFAASEYKGWDLVFNMAQGFYGTSREADAATMAPCQDKAITKVILNHHRIPTAPFLVLPSSDSMLDVVKNPTSPPSFPVFLKPVTEGILGTGCESRVIGAREHLWPKENSKDDGCQTRDVDFATRKGKSATAGDGLAWIDFQDLAEPHIQAACKVALDAWRALGCRDGGRIDIRLDSHRDDDVPTVLEINPVAGLLPNHSPLPCSAAANGISFDQLLAEIIASAMQRVHRVTNY
ncbi:hypothetical protein BJX62DRAFT_231435 [Aspergillus germanicus]